jgi:predicted phosphodiesterase
MPRSLRIQIASDLHLEMFSKPFANWYRVDRLGPEAADLLVLAGDIHNGIEAVRCFADWPIPVLYVPGNHEYYETRIDLALRAMRDAARGTSVRVLSEDVTVIHGLRFVACTLWTDYELLGTGIHKTLAMQTCERFMVDHRLIQGVDANRKRFTPEDALSIHQREKAWLVEQLHTPHDAPTVAITHHGVHPQSVHPRFDQHPANPGFISNLSDVLGLADLWIHGHVHNSFDYWVGRTRVVVNPGSYALNIGQAKRPEDLRWENPEFDPAKLVQLQWDAS